MRSTVAVQAVVLGTLLHGIALPAPRPAAGGAREQRAVRTNCIRFSQEIDKDARSMTFELHNRCDVAVEASLRWTVSCGRGGEGRAEEHQALLEPGRERLFVASAQACTEASWRVHSIKWGWTPVEGASASQ